MSNPMFSGYVDGTSDAGWPSDLQTVVIGWMLLGQFRGKTQALSAAVKYSASHDLSTMEANGNLCRIYGLARNTYPIALPL